MLKERSNTYRQHIQQPELPQIDVEGHIGTYGSRNFKILLFFLIREDKKILRESYETYLIEKFKPTLKKKKQVNNSKRSFHCFYRQNIASVRFNICT